MDKLIINKDESTGSRLVIGNAVENLERFLPSGSTNTIVVTDATVHRIYKDLINRFEHIIIGQGESNKTLVTVETIYRGLLEKNADRSAFVIGIGGGMVTDVTGFTASTYMRGLRFGFIPTTLLGQVDASIGGKNGVNLDGYKNMVGTFNQPEFIICDPVMTSTLPEREFRSGVAEIIKAGIIGDGELFKLIEDNTFERLRTDYGLLTEVIERAINVKTRIVEADEHELGMRRLLNLGHTFGHAFEKGMQNIMHGEAVGAGMVIISRVAEARGILSARDAERIRNVIEKTGLPTEYPVELKKLVKLIRHDKKCEGNTVHMVFPHAIGHCEIEQLSFDEVETMFALPDTKNIAVEVAS